jgi:LacI family transcriptional regulator
MSYHCNEMSKEQVTIHDIAERLNISASTVSRALVDHPRISEATKKKVRQMAEKLNYSPNILASSLRKGKGNVIGVIVPNISRYFFSNVIDSIQREANLSGYNIMICQSQESYENELSNIDTLLNSRVDGIIMSLSASTSTYEHLYKVIDKGVPLVFFDRVPEHIDTSSVVLDDYQGAFDAVEHMINNGCRRIALFAGPNQLNVYRNRKNGYLDALHKYRLPIVDQYVLHALTKEQGYEAAATLFAQKEKPDGIFSSSDFSALGSIFCLTEKGFKIPEEVSVAGFANEPFTAIMEPGLTSVEQFANDIGKKAIELFFDIAGQETQVKIFKREVIRPKLFVRKSTIKMKQN